MGQLILKVNDIDKKDFIQHAECAISNIKRMLEIVVDKKVLEEIKEEIDKEATTTEDSTENKEANIPEPLIEEEKKVEIKETDDNLWLRFK